MAETPPPAEIAQILDELAGRSPARVGLAAASLNGEIAFAVRATELFTQASAIKIPVLWELYRAGDAGELSLDEALPVDAANGAGGCGVLQHFGAVSRLTLGDLAVLMIVLSDNVATNLLIDRVGIEPVNRLLEGHRAAETRLRRKMMDAAARAAGRENTSTPAEAIALMRRLHELSSGADAAASATLATLRLKKESPVTAAIGKDATLATKPGALDGLRTEWSLVETADGGYTMALMADGAEDTVLEPLFRDLAGAVHRAMVGAAS